MFIKSNKLLILVTTLCIIVTSSINASDSIKKLDVNNIEHGSSFLVSNLETVIEIHCNNEDKLNHNNTNLEHSNLGRNNSEYQINRHHVNHKCNNNDNTHQINHNENNLEHSNNEVHHNNSEHNNHENINDENNHNNNANNNNVRNSSEQEQNNNDVVALNINASNQEKESFCNSFTTTIQGVLLIPMTIYGSIISNIIVNDNENISSSNNEMINIRNHSKEFIGNAWYDTIKSFIECVKILGSNTIRISTTSLGNLKAYIVQRIL